MFSIGEFSKMSGLTVKTLRHYHDVELLAPAYIDPATGYRFYDRKCLERARVIRALRELKFSIRDIEALLEDYDSGVDLTTHLETHREKMADLERSYRQIRQSVESLIDEQEKMRSTMENQTFEIEEKEVAAQKIASLRMHGAYSESGQGFSRLGKKFGRKIAGKPFMLCHDESYQEDATFDVCFPIKNGTSTDDIVVQDLAGGRAVTLIHRGPYDTISYAYEKLITYLKEKEYDYDLPTREVYHKGPGMIFKGNPEKYLTELQFILK